MRYQAPIQFMSIKKYHHNNLFKFIILCLYICVDVCLCKPVRTCSTSAGQHAFWGVGLHVTPRASGKVQGQVQQWVPQAPETEATPLLRCLNTLRSNCWR